MFNSTIWIPIRCPDITPKDITPNNYTYNNLYTIIGRNVSFGRKVLEPSNPVFFPQKRPVECHSWVTNPLSFSMAKVSTPTVTSSDRSTDRSVSMDLKCPHTPFTPANTPYSRVKNSAKRPTRANPHVNHSSSTDRILGEPFCFYYFCDSRNIIEM